MTTESGLLGTRLLVPRRPGQILLCLAIACALVLAGTSGASAAAQRRTVSLKVSSASVVAGTKVTLSGAVTKSPKGTKVRIERQAGRRWKALKTVKTTSSKGTFKTTLTATSTTAYRAVAPKTKKLKVATSKARTITVRTPAAATPAPAPVPVPAPTTPAPSLPGKRTTRASQTAVHGEANGKSQAATISADGRYVAYQSWASNIVDGDNNGDSESSDIEGIDVFLWDRQTDTTTLVSKTPPGSDRTSGNRDSTDPAISADGRYIAYASDSTNLVDVDSDDETVDVFVWDRMNDKTTKVSQGLNGETARGDSTMPTISDDGQVIAFTSTATNLTIDTDGEKANVFMWQRPTSSGSVPVTTRVSHPSDGSATQPAMAGSGRYIAYTSTATEATELSNGVKAGKKDVFAWDFDKDENTTAVYRVSADPEGNDTNGDSYAPTIAGNGLVAFTSTASNIVANDQNRLADVFVWDRVYAITRLAHAATGVQSLVPAFSADGRYIAYGAVTAVNDDTDTTDVYVRSWKSAAAPSLVSLTSSGAPATGESFRPAISADGRYVAYESEASDLVAGDTNGMTDIFVWDRLGTP